MSHYENMVENAGLYQYNSFYLTNSCEKAFRYASRSLQFGEIGNIAYTFYITLKKFNFNFILTKEKMEYLDNLLSFCNKNSSPTVIMFTNLQKEKLSEEDGTAFDSEKKLIEHYLKFGTGFRYDGEISFSEGSVIQREEVSTMDTMIKSRISKIEKMYKNS